MSVEHIKICPSLSFQSPNGDTIEVHDVSAAIDMNGEQLDDVRITFFLSPEVWQQVDAQALFHTEPSVRSPVFAGGFDDDQPLKLEAALDPRHLVLLSITCENYWEVGAQIRGASVSSELHHTECWLALSVTQQRGPIWGGFQTKAGGYTPS